MQIAITPETEKAIDAAVAAGGYKSKEDYANEALKYYFQLKIGRLDAALAVGFEQLENGEIIEVDDIDAFFSHLNQEID
ncbi:MAG: type II toxin-antitoxin system ParD family antitoxin [bacterium]